MSNTFSPALENDVSSLPMGVTPVNDDVLEDANGGLLITGLVVAGVALAVADRYVYHRWGKKGK